MDKKLYDYQLPDNLLAKIPASPRDSAKLFVYDTKTDEIIFDRFLNLDKYLPNKSFLVLNNSQVVPSRVTMFKKTGGKVVVLFFVNELITSQNNVVRGLVDRKINLGEKIYFDKENFIEVKNQEKNIFTFKFDYSKEKLFSLLYRYGNMPIPLYLKDSPLKKDELLKKYQTIFADKLGDKKLGSIAAPTASLHFTNRVFKKLKQKGIERLFLKLYVGIGTFAPITEENLKTKKLHQEYYEIDKNTYEKIINFKKQRKKLIAVGTTVVRTVESVEIGLNWLKSENLLSPLIKKTDLFIFPPYNFKMVDILITNFHLPGSSLMMLVEAFLQYKKAKNHLVDLYNIAIKNDFRFYSFGDCMVVK